MYLIRVCASVMLAEDFTEHGWRLWDARCFSPWSGTA